MKKLNILYLLFILTLVSCEDAELAFSGSDDPLNATPELILSDYQITYNSGEVEFHSLQDNLEREVLLNDVRKSELTYNQQQLTSIIEYNPDQTVKDSRTYNYDSNGNVTSMDEIGVYSALSGNATYNRIINRNNNVITYEIPQAFFLGEVFRIELTLNDNGLIQQLKQANSFTGDVESTYDFIYDSNENCTKVNVTRILGGNTIEFTYTYIYDNARNPFYTHVRTNYIPLLLLYGRALLIGNDISVLVTSFGKNNLLRSDTEYYQYTYNNNNYPADATIRQVGTNALLRSAVLNYQE